MKQTEQIITRVDTNVKEAFKKKCEEDNTTISQKLRDFITEYLKKTEYLKI